MARVAFSTTVHLEGMLMDNVCAFAERNRCTEPSSKGIRSPATMQQKTRGGTSEEPEAMWLVLAFSTTDSLEGMRRDNGFRFRWKKH